MLSFKQFLGEDGTTIYIDPEGAARLLAKECSEFIRETGLGIRDAGTDDPLKNVLYRGTANLPSYLTLFTGPKNRRPRDSSAKLHETLNKFFEKYFGVPYRSAGTFVTADLSTAYSYGEAGIFLPVNGYSYVYSPQVIDAYLAFQGSSGTRAPPMHATLYNRIVSDMHDELMVIFNKYLSDIGASDSISEREKKDRFKTFIAALGNGTLPKANEIWMKMVEKWLDLNAEVFKSTGLKQFIESDSIAEVIFKCDKYYLLSLDNLRQDKAKYNRFINELSKHL